MRARQTKRAIVEPAGRTATIVVNETQTERAQITNVSRYDMWASGDAYRREDHPLYEQSRQQIILKFDLCNRSDASDLEDRLIDYLLDDCLKPKIAVRTSTD